MYSKNKNIIITILAVLIVLLIVGITIWNSDFLGIKSKYQESQNLPYLEQPNDPTDVDSSTTTNQNTGEISNPPISSGFTAPIAYIGCSNSQMTVDGYHMDGGNKFWPATPSYNGGTIVKWAESVSGSTGARFFDGFDSLNKSNPGAKTLWVSICTYDTESAADVYNGAAKVIAEARKRIQTIQNVYVSAVNGFIPDGSCHLTGATGVQKAQTAATQLVNNGIAYKGPTISALNTSETRDGCHPEDAGRKRIGMDLLNFFK